MTLNVMTQAVILPCGHSLSEFAAEQLRKCPLCRKDFTSYQPNFSLRSAIKTILPKELKRATESQKDFPRPTKRQEEIEIEEMPFLEDMSPAEICLPCVLGFSIFIASICGSSWPIWK